MKILVLCEGTDEEVVINFLIDNNSLTFTRDDLIGRVPYAKRSLDDIVIKNELFEYGREVKVYRVGDTQKDKLVIPKDLRSIVKPENIHRICTKPELEIIFILNENLLDEYTKSKLKACAFAKAYIKFNKKKYSKNTEVLKEYLAYTGVERIVEALYEYKRIKKGSHEPQEEFLADYVKKK